MMRFILLLLLPCVLQASVKEAAKRVEGHLLLEDFQSALHEAERAHKQYPGERRVQEALLKAYAGARREEKLRQMVGLEWDPHALEELAWGMIRCGAKNGSLPVQAYAAIASGIGRDMRGVELLREFLQSPNVTLRALSISAIAHMRDPLLQEEVLSMLRTERNATVRLELLRAAGSMKLYEAKGLLEEALGSPSATAEEQSAAVEGLLRLYEEPTEQQVILFAKSKRSGFRRLACHLVDTADKREWLIHLESLKKDHDAGVRQLAWQTTGWLQPEIPAEMDAHPEVAIMQAWVAARAGDSSSLADWIQHPRASYRRLAASAACHSGKSALPLLLEMVKGDDPDLRLNSALALVRYPKEVERATAAIREALRSDGPLMKGGAPFLLIQKSEYSAQTPQQATANMAVRLELLNQLAILGDPHSIEAMRAFLKETPRGITAMAAGAMLQEGDAVARDAIYALLEEETGETQLQAALTLALWGRDSRALNHLQTAYPNVSRQHKEHILSALGAIGDKTAIPFLQHQLGDPSPQLRLIAAASLLQCLNS